MTSSVEGMLGIDDQKNLFLVKTNGDCTPLLSTFSFDPIIRPVAIKDSNGLHIAAVTDSSINPPKLVAKKGGAQKSIPLPADTKVLTSLEAELLDGTFHVLATVQDGGSGRLITWAPFAPAPLDALFESPVVSVGGRIEGAPVTVGHFVVIPGTRADILAAEFNPSLRLRKSADIKTGAVVPDSIPSLSVDDLIVRLDAGEPVSQKITPPVLTRDGETFYPIAADFPTGATDLFAYQHAATLSGTFSTTTNKLKLAASDQATAEDDWLLIKGDFYQVDKITLTSTNQRVAKLFVPNTNGNSPGSGAGNGKYVRPLATQGRVAPFMQLDPADNGNWDANLLQQIPLIFPGQTPSEIRGKAFSIAVDNKPTLVVLNKKFQNAVVNPVDFLVDAAFGQWLRDAGDTSNNPELSWEYWNGTGWWKLPITLDETQHLKATGNVEFVVPSDIDASDWAGKTNHWIRARLIGGDYGKEKVTVKISPDGKEQTVERSTEGIRPPSVLKLHLSYAVCREMPPTFVLTQDSGTYRDQSDANRTADAIVEAFVPLAVTLGRLSQAESAADQAEDCLPDCGCGKHAKTQAAGAATSPPVPSPSAGGRALYIGLQATPSEAPVNVLLLVKEAPSNNAFAPLTVEALMANRFVPIVANDATRALGESGLLEMSFPVAPTPSDLFGQKGLTWLRLRTNAETTGDWNPVLRGAYLNGVWASATETLTRELLGSSNGEPRLTVRLARPPVLRNTLELRVKEPLGEEERKDLLAQDERRVLSNVEGLPGDWVLWKQVFDPDDERADARVYALDETTGEIRFGDGQQGAIPPIGRDAVVAFRYSRTEPDPQGGDRVPSNAVAPRTALNLVSPVESVESVIAADPAAGGAPTESDERVLRYGFARLRHRNRAVTPYDLEDLARQSSPDFAQARALVRQGYLRLVIVMRGTQPQPSAAQIRELRRLLLAAAPMALQTPSALRIEGPKVLRLRIELRLRVERLDQAGTLSAFVKQRLESFFDTTTGGTDQDGWALGSNPSEVDIALALLDAPHLESIEGVALQEITDDGNVRPWPKTLKANELALLAADAIRIQFEIAEGQV
ncbi:MAG: hypothetical protein HOP19_17785 [Acidobacteria bacterium]|nr:hypothetical protein [Acidobacteriota bacterium]